MIEMGEISLRYTNSTIAIHLDKSNQVLSTYKQGTMAFCAS